MSAPRAIVLLCATTFSGGCPVEPLCEALTDEVRRCDLVPEQDDTCMGAGFGELTRLLDAIETDGCSALYDAKTDVVLPTVCDAMDWECPAPLHPLQTAVVSRYPLVLVSGIDDAPIFDWDPGIERRLDPIVPTYHVVLPPWLLTERRSPALWEALQPILADHERVNLVCYAVGGLACRHAVSPGGLFADDPLLAIEARNAVASITTIATPHRGSNVADVALATPDNDARRLISAGVLPSATALSDDERDAQIQDVLEELSLDGMRAFNDRVPNAAEVRYHSWAGVSYAFGQTIWPIDSDIDERCATNTGEPAYRHHQDTHDPMTEGLWVLSPLAEIAVDSNGHSVSSPNDGMVPVTSAAWGSFHGCLPTDHYDVVGRLTHPGVDPVTGFYPAGFLSQLALRLAEEGS